MMTAPPPPKELPKRASPRATPRRQSAPQSSLPVGVKLAGAADGVAHLKFLRDSVNEIQSLNLRAKSVLDTTEKVLKVGPDGGLDVQAMTFVVQRRNRVKEMAEKEDAAHAKMMEVSFIAEQRRVARSTSQLVKSQQMLERALPADQVAQSHVNFNNAWPASAAPQQAAQATQPALLNPYSVARSTSTNFAPMRAQRGAACEPTGLYTTTPSPYPGLAQPQRAPPANYLTSTQLYPLETNGPYRRSGPPTAPQVPAYGASANHYFQSSSYPTEAGYRQNPSNFQAL